MPLDPQAKAVLERVARANLPPYPQLGAEGARKLYRETRGALAAPAQEVASVVALRAAGPGGEIPVRLYRPLGSTVTEALPVLVYFHGGGWTIGDLDTHDVVCRELANLARCAVASVDYRLGPEHRFPAAVEDAMAATRWVASEAGRLALDPQRIAVGGDSAGGNLATVVALIARDEGGPALAMQALFYPATDMAADAPSHLRFAEGHLLTREAILWFRSNYLARRGRRIRLARLAAEGGRPLAAAAGLRRSPPGFDPLVDEGRAYADRLRAAGVEVTYECFEGMIHGFVTMGGVVAAAHHALYRCAQGLRQAFAGIAR